MKAKVERVQQELLDVARAQYRPEPPSQQQLERRQASIQLRHTRRPPRRGQITCPVKMRQRRQSSTN